MLPILKVQEEGPTIVRGLFWLMVFRTFRPWLVGFWCRISWWESLAEEQYSSHGSWEAVREGKIQEQKYKPPVMSLRPTRAHLLITYSAIEPMGA